MRTVALAAALAGCLVAPFGQVRAQAPVTALDASWVAVCAGARPGTAFFQRCQEILNAGPGSADRRSDAAVGNNLGQLPAQTGNAGERRTAAGEAEVHSGTSGRLGWSLFASLGETRRRDSDFDSGFKGDLRRFGGGIDWRLSDHAVWGAVLSQLDADRRFAGGSGRADSRTRAFTTFLDWHPEGRFALGGYLGVGDVDLDLQRQVRYGLVLNAGTAEQATATVDALARARPGGQQRNAGAVLRWDFSEQEFGRGLRFGTDYSRTRIDGFVETGGAGLALRRGRSERTSHTVNLGLDLAWTRSTSTGVLVPYLRLDWFNELKEDDRGVAVSFADDSAATAIRFQRERGERSYGEAAVGLSAVFAGGVSAFIDAQRLFSNSQLDHHLITVGLRFER